MSSTAAKRIFGDDSRLRRNVMLACSTPFLAEAILTEVICDHRVIEFIMKVGPLAARIILQVEAKLGRKLQRSRIEKLIKTYQARNTCPVTKGECSIRSTQKTKELVSSVMQEIAVEIPGRLNEVLAGLPRASSRVQKGNEHRPLVYH